MAAFERVKSGISQMDTALDSIRLGDNVVWRISDLSEFRLFCLWSRMSGRLWRIIEISSMFSTASRNFRLPGRQTLLQNSDKKQEEDAVEKRNSVLLTFFSVIGERSEKTSLPEEGKLVLYFIYFYVAGGMECGEKCDQKESHGRSAQYLYGGEQYGVSR